MNKLEIVTYKSAEAYYNLIFENNKMVVAELQQYLGKQEHKPPKKIVYLANETPYRPSFLEDMANAIPKTN